MNITAFVTQLVLFSFLIETVVEILKPLYQPVYDRFPKVPLPYYFSVAFGIAGAILFGVNGLPMFGIEGHSIVGQAITGLICSRGSNFVHEIYNKLRSLIDKEPGESVVPVVPVAVIEAEDLK